MSERFIVKVLEVAETAEKSGMKAFAAALREIVS
jgi:hypothetical protein